MPRIQEISDDAASPEISRLFGEARQAMGMVPNVFRSMGNSPAVLRSFMTMQHALGGGVLDRALQQKIAVLVAQFDRSAYCLAVNTAVGTMVGASEAALLDARRTISAEPRTAAALAFAHTALERRGSVGDEDVASLRKAGFSDAEVTEIAAAIGFNLFANYFNLIADTSPDLPVIPMEIGTAAGAAGSVG